MTAGASMALRSSTMTAGGAERFTLGQEYSANVFNDLYSGERKTDIRQEQSTHQEQPDFAPKADIVSGVASVVSAFGGLFGSGASGGDEPQDTTRQKRKKKKKRTRRIG